MHVASSAYSYALVLYGADGAEAGRVPVTVDWEAAEEWTRFRALRRGLLGPTELRAARILPLWSREPGEPYIRGFRADLSRSGSAEVFQDFPTAYFKELAVRASSEMVERGRLEKGETFRYRAVAFPRNQEPEEPRSGFVAEEVIPPIPLRTTALEAFGSAAVAVGEPHPDDMPAFVPHRVLEEATDLARAAGDKETGGVLIGHLHRDPSVPEIFIEITAQVPARQAQGELTRLTFTAESWTAVQAALDLRRRDEVMLGWWHSHPARAWCQKCPVEKQRVCPLAADFFSEHDRQLHRTVFPRAYSVALVVNDSVNGLSYSLFGWREGVVASRGFSCTGEPRASERLPAELLTRGDRGGN